LGKAAQVTYQIGLVSTIIPVYNRAKLLKEAATSVLSQTYRPIEIVIVDDGSSDDTPLVVRKLALENPEIVAVKQKNAGPGVARRKGLEVAKGEFVQFLDSDDLLYPNKFELQVAALQIMPAADACYGKTWCRDSSGRLTGPWGRTGEEIEMMFPSMLARRWWGTSTPLYRRKALDRAGDIASLRNEEDWELDCRIAATGGNLAHVAEWVSEQRAIARERASFGGSTKPEKLADRLRARHLILDHALSAGVDKRTVEFGQFVDYSFLVARQAVAVGLEHDAMVLVARLAAIRPSFSLKGYHLVARFCGGRPANSVFEKAHQIMRFR
jgi:glycosyltransferase involved in cell wall biosynthesis